MNTLFLYPPNSARSAHDVIGPKFAACLTRAGLDSSAADLWPDKAYRAIFGSRLPKQLWVFYLLVGVPWALVHLNKIRRAKVVSINGPGIPRDPTMLYERIAKRLNCRYVYHMQDNYLHFEGLSEQALIRIKLADAVAVPTQNLKNVILAIVPSKKVFVLEEAIDVDRFANCGPATEVERRPVVVWCGNPGNLKEMPFLLPVLCKLRKDIQFTFRVITGDARPSLECDLPFEWHPYSRATEPKLLAGACAGLAPVNDNPYTRCKGSYKVKTYLTAGVPPVASPVGHQATMVKSGFNGFLASSPEEWIDVLTRLIQDRTLSQRLGAQAREDAVAKYSYDAVAPQWVEAFRRIENPSFV